MMCNCSRCVRSRINTMNNYYRKHGKLDKIVILSPPTYERRLIKCSCKRCQTNRDVRQKYYDAHEGQTAREKRIGVDFKPFGPGRYSWDRTTARDYEHEK